MINAGQQKKAFNQYIRLKMKPKDIEISEWYDIWYDMTHAVVVMTRMNDILHYSFQEHIHHEFVFSLSSD